MHIDTVITVSLDITDKFYFLWNFYLAFVLASVGWLASIRYNLNVRAKIIVSLSMLIVFAINMFAIHRNIEALIIILDELRSMIGAMNFANPDTKEKFKHLASSNWQYSLSYPAHLFFDSLLLFLVWNDGVWARLRSPDREN